MSRNQHGLPRRIPAPVKAEVRKRCGYGCVICGMFPYDYDHLRIQWADAREHDPDDIVLLCDRHHREKTVGLLEVSIIAQALKRRGNPGQEFRFKLSGTSQSFQVHWPFNDISAALQGVVVDGAPILRLDMQDDPLEPVLLSGAFTDLRGREICRIERNEFVSRSQAVGDFILTGNRFHYKTAESQTSLRFSLGSGGLTIEDIFHVRGDAFVRSLDDSLVVGNLSGTVRNRENHLSDCQVAIAIASSTDEWDFMQWDLSKLPSSTIERCAMHGCHTGIAVGGMPRYRPSYTFGW